MPLLAGLKVGSMAFGFLKDKDKRKAIIDKAKKGYKWAKEKASKIKSVKKTDTGYSVIGDGINLDTGKLFGSGEQTPGARPGTEGQTTGSNKALLYGAGAVALLMALKK